MTKAKIKGKREKRGIRKINNLVEICVILWLILSVGIGAVSAEGPIWAANPGWDLPDVGKGAAPAFVDIDADGDYDLFIGEQYGISFAYENTGSATSPNWTAKPSWDLPDLDMGSKPAFADLDNDGDYDVLIGEGPSGATYGYENTGSATSPNWTANSSWDPPTLEWMGAKPALADLDDDDDYDLLLYQAYTGDPFAYENDGSVSSPNWTRKSSWDPPFAGQGATPDFADIDADGDYDLLVGIKTDGATYAYENTGGASSPTWSRKPSWDPPNVTQLAAKPALADLDNDGDHDLLIGTMDGISLGFENTANECLGNCYEGTVCEGTLIMENVKCSVCLSEAGRSWEPNKDANCFGATEPFDLCLDYCPQCCDREDNDVDGKTDYPNDPECTCGLDPSETAPAPPVPELASVILLGCGLLMLAAYVGLRRRRRE